MNFVKPVGAECNLSCAYCYYLKNQALLLSGNSADRPLPYLELYIRQQIEATTGDVITFSWHGGEPLLAGIEFYRRAVQIQKVYCPPDKKIINGIQTNGTLINESWCRFLSDENFIVGLSMDGPERLHNICRKDKQGKGSFSKVLDAFDMLTMHGIDPEILCVLHSGNADFPDDVYGCFHDLGVSFITFLPLAERPGSGKDHYNVHPVKFGEFLCRVFDVWKQSDIGKIKVQIFEETLRIALGQPHNLCVFRPECGEVPVIEHNGNFYSCDHFVDPAHYMGNIMVQSVVSMLNSEKQKQFGRDKFSTLPTCCSQCEVIEFCHGECPKNRFIISPEGEHGLNYLCKGYKKFFNHCRPFIKAVSDMYQS